MKKVLVAGATGYLGRFVVREFKRRGYWVRALARNPQKLVRSGPFLEPAVTEYVDDVFVGEVTRPETLDGLMNDVDYVFSSIGITRQKDKLTFRDVDYQGNKNLLDIAVSNHIKKFVFVSVFHGEKYTYLAGIKAREDFIKDLRASGLDYSVVRPTGYFSDMSEFFRMARSGRVYLIGDGQSRMNPIHGADLARVCVDAMEGSEHAIDAGGPEVFSYLEIAKLAFDVLGKQPRITNVPVWMVSMTAKVAGMFSGKYSELLKFFATAMQNHAIAPKFGDHTLKTYFEELAKHA